MLQQIATQRVDWIVVNFVTLPKVDDLEKEDVIQDSVSSCATEVLPLGLLWHGFHDAICEGDEERPIRYWKFWVVLFKSSWYFSHHSILNKQNKTLAIPVKSVCMNCLVTTFLFDVAIFFLFFCLISDSQTLHSFYIMTMIYTCLENYLLYRRTTGRK